MSLKEKVMVVNLSISQWTARKYDEKVSHEVETIHNAKEAGRFNKILLQSKVLKDIAKTATKARLFHYENTLPWGDNGDRILPCEKYFDYVTSIGNLKMEYVQFVDTFIEEYAEEKEKAKVRLNTMYKESDYPDPQRLRKKFDIIVSFMPIAESDDLRVNLSDSVTDKIKKQITVDLQNRVEACTIELLDRLKTAVGHMAETLQEPDKIFRDSLVENIQTLTETLPLLNFNNDERVNEAIDLCKSLIIDADALRYNRKIRKEYAKKAAQILENI